MKKFLILLLIVPALLVGCGGNSDPEMDSFAQCLDEAGAEYYGAYWCGNCQRQNEILGDSKDLIDHIECGEGVSNSETELCLLEGIEAFPTWRFANGNELVGLQGVEDLAAASGCAIPGQESVMFGPEVPSEEVPEDE